MRPRSYEWLLWLGAAAPLAIQLLIPPVIGLANNGDFSKIIGRFALEPGRGDWSDSFVYVTGKYRVQPRSYWNSGLVSSELFLTAIAVTVSRLVPPARQFDIRWMGAAHGIILLLAFWLAFLAARPLPFRRAAAFLALVVLIFTDVCYASYLNSFYMDTAALLGLLLMTFAACACLMRWPEPAMVALFLAGALMFVTSKSQHALFAVIPAGMAVLCIKQKRLAISVAAACIAAAAVTWMLTPRDYPAPPLYSVIFDKILPPSDTIEQDLAELGLDETYRKFVGSHAYSPNSPINDTRWLHEFLNRTSYGAVARFYFRHPDRMGRILYGDLRKEGPSNRAPNLGNYRREDGKAPGAKANHFDAWSRLRSSLFRWWPSHAIAWYAVALVFSCVSLLYLTDERSKRLSLLLLMILLLGGGEYVLSSLTDSCETHRHLFLFHAATDLSVCLFMLRWLQRGTA
jgi:hypothetical protein